MKSQITKPQPAQLQCRRWSAFVIALWQQFNDSRILQIAAGVTFYGLVALVPGLALLVSLYGIAFDAASVGNQIGALSGFLPGDASTLLQQQLVSLTSEPASSLSLKALISLAIALWSATSATRALIDGLNIAFGTSERRTWWTLTMISLAFTVAGILAAVMVLAVTIAIPVGLRWIDPTGSSAWVTPAGYILLVLLMWAEVAALYRWAPCRDRLGPWLLLAPGSLAAVAAVIVFSLGFGWYARTFSLYSSYGSLGVVVGFMIWSWMIIVILLSGAVINSLAERPPAGAGVGTAGK